tara:strand:+ start:7419 stop:7748 length:330 start_codon:yes stop_codon:yes gene_type:complete
MQYKDLKEKAKNLGMRVTKDVRGKRVKLTSNELRARIRLNFENSVKNAQQVIRVCKTIIVPSNQGTSRIPPPPPPPPPRAVPRNPVVNSTRAKLMAELKNTLKKRALKK